jgi:hypothetical protein
MEEQGLTDQFLAVLNFFELAKWTNHWVILPVAKRTSSSLVQGRLQVTADQRYICNPDRALNRLSHSRLLTQSPFSC